MVIKSASVVCYCSRRVCSTHLQDMEVQLRSHHRLLAVVLAGWLV